jgi:NAD-dependent dihydropyrimidine dehydrogenase PreA subunit
MKRKIIEIDRELCDGCGNCTTACAEGALELDAEGKAVLVRDIYCDGLGACLDICPTGALAIVEREAPSFDEAAAQGARPAASAPGDRAAAPGGHHAGCPGSAARSFVPAARRAFATAAPGARAAPELGAAPARSELGQWPIQLQLISPAAPCFRECDLLIAADCTAFALGSFHAELLRGKSLVIACPKLDRTEGYVGKLAELVAGNTVYSITVAIMEVPCCSGLSLIVEEAVARSGKNIAVRKVVVGLDGRVL